MKPGAARMRLAAVAAVLAIAGTLGYVAVQAAPPAKVVRVVAKRFEYAPRNFTLKKGQKVVLELTSEDIPMGFNLPDFNVRADMVPAKVTRIELTPDKTGTFVFLCDIFCGSGHEEMHGTITVVD